MNGNILKIYKISLIKFMKALIFDKSKTDWETSKGFELVDAPKPVLGAEMMRK